MKLLKATMVTYYLPLILLLNACGKIKEPPPRPTPPPSSATTYTNPVFKPILADPTVIKDPNSEYYYAYGTEDFWSTDNKNHLVAIVRSKDLVNWSYVRDAFSSKPGWKPSGGLWAPEVVNLNGKYVMYYSYSTWGDSNPALGIAEASSPEGPFTDLGKLFNATDIGIANVIDAFYYEDGGKKYLFFGSYSGSATGGIYGVELSADGKSVPDYNTKFKIAANDFEGTIIHKRGNYYYFIGSKNNCCDGASSNYQLRVGRSTSLKGPYLDKAGNNIANRGNGTMMLQRNSKFAGPGHCSAIFKDKNGAAWILYHAMDVNNAMIGTVNQRALMLDKVNWDADGWPIVHDGTPSTTAQTKPAL